MEVELCTLRRRRAMEASCSSCWDTLNEANFVFRTITESKERAERAEKETLTEMVRVCYNIQTSRTSDPLVEESNVPPPSPPLEDHNARREILTLYPIPGEPEMTRRERLITHCVERWRAILPPPSPSPSPSHSPSHSPSPEETNSLQTHVLPDEGTGLPAHLLPGGAGYVSNETYLQLPVSREGETFKVWII